MTFPGTITDGKLLLDSKADFTAHLHTLEGRRVEISVEKFVKHRTNNQNRYFHGVVIPVIQQETGEDPEKIKAFLKEKFGAKIVTFDSWIPKPTHLMDTVELTELVEGSRLWANEFLKVNIPDPNEGATAA
jgi:hypothetical protein